MSSVWALLAAFEDPLQIPGGDTCPFEGAFVKGVDSISWMANNTKKLLGSQRGGPHCWTFLSTAAYGKRNKVPQVCFSPYTHICSNIVYISTDSMSWTITRMKCMPVMRIPNLDHRIAKSNT